MENDFLNPEYLIVSLPIGVINENGISDLFACAFVKLYDSRLHYSLEFRFCFGQLLPLTYCLPIRDRSRLHYRLLQRARDRGVVALKVQSAYRRPIDFSFPARADAERAFNRFLSDGRAQLAWPDARPLDDYLFQQSMRYARELNLPVQVHTGHVTGLRNRVDKANAALFAPTLETHRQVNFDLFHGNWPYMGDLLFLVKSYPNVSINLCWLYMIDPIYSR